MATKQFSIRIEPEIEQRLADLARRTGRSRSFYVKEAILNHLEDLEDTYLGEQALDEFRKSGEEAIPLEDVEWPE
ncbi:MAG: type II toxin-antitoxin system RelB family antitoxin [Acidimicrobiia bacterium]